MAQAPQTPSADFDAWLRAAAKSAPNGDLAALNWQTPDGISVKPLYTAEDTKALPHANTLDRKSTRLNSSHIPLSRMPSSA